MIQRVDIEGPWFISKGLLIVSGSHRGSPMEYDIYGF
jgi:hypothetical protein